MKELLPNYYASTKEELKTKLEGILKGKAPYNPDFKRIETDFSLRSVGDQIKTAIEAVLNH